jgi:hypothetical protein
LQQITSNREQEMFDNKLTKWMIYLIYLTILFLFIILSLYWLSHVTYSSLYSK